MVEIPRYRGVGGGGSYHTFFEKYVGYLTFHANAFLNKCRYPRRLQLMSNHLQILFTALSFEPPNLGSYDWL